MRLSFLLISGLLCLQAGGACAAPSSGGDAVDIESVISRGDIKRVGYHYLGSGACYYQIGESMGQAMEELVK
jgi:hypothetical protein